MYQPEDNGLATYEIPTARETAPALAQPPHGCPDTPGRECMLRYLYANKHHHLVKCATCGIMSSKVSAFQRKQKAAGIPVAMKIGKQAKPKTAKPKVAKQGTAADRKRQYDREYEKVRRERRKANMTPEQREAERHRRVASQSRARDRNRDKINEQKRAARARAAAAKLAAMTPEQAEAAAAAKRQRALDNLAKGRAKTVAESVAKKAANAERVKERQRENERAKTEARQAKPDREATLRANLELVRAGKKPPNRCEAVTLALEWMLDAGIQEVAMLDFLPAVNKYMHKKVANSGALGRSVRDYGLTVRTEYRGKGVNKAFLFLDDKARSFVDGGFVKHGRIAR